MPNQLLQWLTQKLAERFAAIFGRLFASRIETLVVLQEAADRELIEQQAKVYEASGLTQLAEQLRQRASTLSSETPGSLALPAIRHLAEHDLSVPSVTDDSAAKILPFPTDDRRPRLKQSGRPHGHHGTK